MIPHMGAEKIADRLTAWAAISPLGSVVVEVGSWMGAGTAALARGCVQADVPLHTYDYWTANASQIAKAAAFGVTLHPYEDLLPHVRRVVDPVGAHVFYHQGNIKAATWDGAPIAMYVDDASKQAGAWEHVTRTFFSSLIEGAIVVLMDFYWCRAKGGKYLPQVQYIESRPEQFIKIAGPFEDSSTAAFCYRSV